MPSTLVCNGSLEIFSIPTLFIYLFKSQCLELLGKSLLSFMRDVGVVIES